MFKRILVITALIIATEAGATQKSLCIQLLETGTTANLQRLSGDVCRGCAPGASLGAVARGRLSLQEIESIFLQNLSTEAMVARTSKYEADAKSSISEYPSDQFELYLSWHFNKRFRHSESFEGRVDHRLATTIQTKGLMSATLDFDGKSHNFLFGLKEIDRGVPAIAEKIHAIIKAGNVANFTSLQITGNILIEGFSTFKYGSRPSEDFKYWTTRKTMVFDRNSPSWVKYFALKQYYDNLFRAGNRLALDMVKRKSESLDSMLALQLLLMRPVDLTTIMLNLDEDLNLYVTEMESHRVEAVSNLLAYSLGQVSGIQITPSQAALVLNENIQGIEQDIRTSEDPFKAHANYLEIIDKLSAHLKINRAQLRTNVETMVFQLLKELSPKNSLQETISAVVVVAKSHSLFPESDRARTIVNIILATGHAEALDSKELGSVLSIRPQILNDIRQLLKY